MLLALLIVVEIVDVDDGRLVATKSYSSVKSNAAMVATAVAAALLFFVSVGDLRGGDIGVGDMNVSTEVISSKSKKFQLLVDTSLISSL